MEPEWTPPKPRTEGFSDWLPEVSPTWQWDPAHLVHVRAHLDRVTAGEIRKLLVLMPPRHGKSEQNTVRYPVFRLERDPGFRVAIGAYSQGFAKTFGRKARRIARQRFAISDERSASTEWETASGGVYRSCGVGSPPTGEGFNLVSVDDPIRSREEADSLAYRERAWEWMTEELYTRLEPGGAYVVTMTPWHEDDPAARIQAGQMGEGWTVVRLPALAEPGDPIGRPVGTALWPTRFDEAALVDIRETVKERAFSALYQCRPTPREGSFFQIARLEFVDVVPAGLKRVRAWDLAYTKDENDWTAGVLIAGPDSAGLFYICDVVRGQWEAAARNLIIRQTATDDGKEVRIYGPQDAGAGKESAARFVQILAGWSVTTTPARGSKEFRAEPLAAQINAGNVRLVKGPWTGAFIEELRTFPRGAHDDQVDASADAFTMLASPPALRVLVS